MEKCNLPVVGTGYDVHCLCEGRKLILGGIEIPHTLGLLGHSDADVLIHSIMDSILGALHLPDIGNLFPDCSAEFKDIDSRILLQKVMGKVEEKGWEVANIDATIIAQKPKLAPFIPKMEEELTRIVQPAYWVNIKATTTEKLGFTGRMEGIAAQAVTMLYPV